jgi:DNA-binding response OmpR family regulator
MLVVDDELLNRTLLATSLEEEAYTVETAHDGQPALDMLRERPFDVVLLDLLMPEMDGYQVLEEMKANPNLRHIPVIVISALDELDSVVRCIEMGATDYLPKPFDPVLLRARINASLASKRLRDLELEYLEQVGHVTAAASALETATFEPDSLNGVAARSDALGQLARVFQQMAHEVQAREERLLQQVQELRIVIDEARQAKKVAEITESDYFRRLRGQADQLRSIIEGSNADSESSV